MKNIFAASALCIMILAACNSFEAQHKRARNLAKTYCRCFSALEGKVNPNLMQLYNVGYPDSLQLDDLVKELTDEEIQEHKKLAAIIQDETSSVGKCVNWADAHTFGTTPLNNDKNPVSHYSIMHETPDCKLGYAFISGGINRVSNALNRQGL